MATIAQTRELNEEFLDRIMNGGGQLKVAADAISEYTRYRIRESGIQRALIPPISLQDTDLDRIVDSPLPAKIVDMEPDSPAATSVSFGHFPDQFYMFGRRYLVTAARILSPWFQADIEELRTHVMDVRQIMSDNALKDMQYAEDAAFFSAIDRILVGPDQISTIGGVAQWRTDPGSISRNGLVEMKKIMPSATGRLIPTKVVANYTTMLDVCKLPRNEVGGDWSQELFKNGWVEDELLKMKVYITIKYDLVPNGRFYMFAEPKFLGKFFVFTDTTMSVKREAFLLSYFAWQTIGSTIANPLAIAIQDFAQSQ